MLNLFKAPTESFHILKVQLFNLEYVISYKFFQKDDDLFIDEVFYFGAEENKLINAYLNILHHRALDMLDRVSVKEFDYFLRENPSRPYFDKISKELLELVSLGEKIKGVHKKSKEDSKKIYDEAIYGPYEFMSLGEKLELVEEVISHQSLVRYELNCSNVEDKIIYLQSKLDLKESDIKDIQECFKKLGLDFLEVNL